MSTVLAAVGLDIDQVMVALAIINDGLYPYSALLLYIIWRVQPRSYIQIKRRAYISTYVC